MLSIMLFSRRGEGYAIGNKLIHEGNHVKLWLEDPKASAPLFKGQVVDKYEGHLATTDLAIDIDGRAGRAIDAIRARGTLALGGSVQTMVNEEKDLHTHLLRLAGLDKCDPKVAGVPLIVCGFFDGVKFARTWTGHEYARLLVGERGPITGSMGCVLMAGDTRLSLDLLRPMTTLLAASKFIGWLELGVVVDSGRVVARKLQTKLSTVACCAAVDSMHTRLDNWLFSLASERELRNSSSPFALGLAGLSAVPNQHAMLQRTEEIDKHFWPGYDQVLGFVTARGDTPHEARKRALRTARNVFPIDAIYRTDVGYSPLFEGDTNGRQTRHDYGEYPSQQAIQEPEGGFEAGASVGYDRT